MHENDNFRQDVQAILKNIESYSGQGAVYHALNDQKFQANSKVCDFCSYCLDQPTTASLCRYTTCTATMHSVSSGEPHYQRCWAGLICVTIALAPRNVCQGGLSLGGFYFEGEGQDLEGILKQRLSYLRKSVLDNYVSRLQSLHETSPSVLRGIVNFSIEATFSSGINSHSFFSRQNQKYIQQRQIAEAFADLRIQREPPPDITGNLHQLAVLLDQNDKEVVMNFISTYMARILLACNWNLVKLKAHLRVLLSVITSQDILRGTEWAAAISRELRYMTRLEKAGTTEDCCYEAAEMVMEYFSKSNKAGSGTGNVIDRAINWLHLHYHEKIDLETISRGIGASVSSIVHQINHKLGKTYKQILDEIRIAEAKKLLATTSLEITDIAIRCGFYDQSHFTKAFKKAANMTPGQFRHFLTLPKDEILK
ncbi:MAG: hypothetical protein A2283_09300 [Lentisphaerae bacterium RIFOXYA12_FULL_48_11]|nr:MAG: hypothetical protein A2283_09300 [Lentisphaerae bacterium RIFOXYA12_FULL_48_11]